MLRRPAAFTLVELLVVIVLISLLIGMLMAVLSQSRRAAQRTVCLNNMAQLEKAHLAYTTSNDGLMLGTATADPKSSWIEQLRDFDDQLLMRSPLDTSPHFGGGTPINGKFRLTSYAINYNLSADNPEGMSMIDRLADPSQTVHLVIKTFEGENAVLDHVKPRAWHAPGLRVAMANASKEVQINAHGGDADSLSALSAYGFLDGHAEQATFEQVYGEDGGGGFNPRDRGRGNGNNGHNGTGGPPSAPPARR